MTNFWQTSYVQRYHDTKRDQESKLRAHIDRALAEDHPDDDDKDAVFEIDVPDHLPTSPLCPLSPKHKSGGRGICPLHGRRGDKRKGQTRTGSLGAGGTKREPEIVFDSGVGGSFVTPAG